MKCIRWFVAAAMTCLTGLTADRVWGEIVLEYDFRTAATNANAALNQASVVANSGSPDADLLEGANPAVIHNTATALGSGYDPRIETGYLSMRPVDGPANDQGLGTANNTGPDHLMKQYMGTTNFTTGSMVMIIKPQFNGLDATRRTFFWHGTSNSSNDMLWLLNDDDLLGPALRRNDSAPLVSLPNVAWDSNTWYMLAASWKSNLEDNGENVMYLRPLNPLGSAIFNIQDVILVDGTTPMDQPIYLGRRGDSQEESGNSDVALFQLYNNALTAVEFNNLYNQLAMLPPENISLWRSNLGGDWTTNANWDPAAPITAGSTVYFGTYAGIVNTPQAVNLDADLTVDKIDFNNSNSYTISGSHTLTLASATTPLTVTGGSHQILSTVVLQNSGNVSVAAGGLLSLTEIGASGVSLNKSGPGTLEITGNVQYTGDTTVSNGELQIQQLNPATEATANGTVASNGKLVANNIRLNALTVDGTVEIRANGGTSGASKAETLTVGAAGKLNLKDNDLVIGTGDMLAVRAQIKLGRSGLDNTAAAVGITSDMMTNAAHGFGYAAGTDPRLSPLLVPGAPGSGTGTLSGQTFDADSVLVKFTYRGDADLDGDSDLDDLGHWANAFTGDLGLGATADPTTLWTQGDWDYDGDTDLDDLGFWSSSFTGDLGGGGLSIYAPDASAGAIAALGSMGITVVPEPSGLALCLIGLILGGARCLKRDPPRA